MAQFLFLLYIFLSHTCNSVLADQCYPFEVDVHIPFDSQEGSTLIGYPLNSTRADDGFGAILDTGRAALLSSSQIVVTEDPDEECFFDPMTCENGFTLSFLFLTFPGQDADTSPLYFLSSGAQYADSWGVAFAVGGDFMRFTLNSASEEYSAQDDTFTYDSADVSAYMHIGVTWDLTTLSLYRDGVLVSSDNTATVRSVGVRTYPDFLIGNATEYANGVMDELLFFYESKDADFIAALHGNYDGGVADCKHTCISVSNDMYTSCTGANMFVQCDDDSLTEHACPLGYFWDNTNKECALGSDSASADTTIVTEIQTAPCVPNECLNDPCQNGETCESYDTGFNCSCPPGYEGGYCEVDIDECASSPCVHGDCVDQVNSYTCDCDDGYYSTLCDEYDGCFTSPCLNGALDCDDVVAGDEDVSFNCTCAPGYTNTTCDVDIDECESDPCENDGTCNDQVNGYNCTCPLSYIGDHCENFDECVVNPCRNGGNCTEGSVALDSLDDYTCSCAHGFGGGDCEDEDECLTQDVDCQNGGTCVDGDGSWTCACADGYNGTNCETDIDECESDPCLYGGTCDDDVNGYTCACVSPYDGANCENFNYCVDDPCVNGTCHDFPDTSDTLYNCTCTEGYYGQNCSIEDECVTQAVTCQHGGTCEDLEDDYVCTGCDAGYDGQLCDNDIDECVGSPCGEFGTCNDQVNAYTCTCIDTYIGENCTEFNDCFEVTECGNHGTCVDLTDDYECSCDEGYYDDTCSSEDECVTEDVECQNGGTCSDTTDDDWDCACVTGYYGGRCQREDFCITLEPCENGATCESDDDQYTCDCADGYEDDTCSTEIFCITEDVTCQNGGTCNNLDDTWECECADGYVGDTCAVVSPCMSDPCETVGTEECEVLSTTERECHCYDGFRRSDCSRGPCYEEPCNATGMRECHDFSNATYTCECTATYEGDTCSILKELKEVSGQYTLRQLTYTEQHANTSSHTYTQLSGLVQDGLFEICECEVSDIVFTSGSIIVSFTLHVANDLDTDGLLDDLEAAAVDGTLIDGYDVSADEITLEESSSSSSGSSNKDNDPDDDKYKIALTVVAVFLGILIFVLIIIIIFGQKMMQQHKVAQDRDGSTVELDNASLVRNEENQTGNKPSEKPLRHPSLAELTGKPKLTARNAPDHLEVTPPSLQYEDRPFRSPAKALPAITGRLPPKPDPRSPPPLYESN